MAQFNKVLECCLPKLMPAYDSPGRAAITVSPRLLKSVQSLNAFPGLESALGTGLLSICRQALWPQQGTSLRKTSQEQGLPPSILTLWCLQMWATQLHINVSVPKLLCAPSQPVGKHVGSHRVSPANANLKGSLRDPTHGSLLHLHLGPRYHSSSPLWIPAKLTLNMVPVPTRSSYQPLGIHHGKKVCRELGTANGPTIGSLEVSISHHAVHSGTQPAPTQ